MTQIIQFNRIFAYTQDKQRSYEASFSDGVNIVYGNNTAGKSTLFNLILYCLGINDVREKLSEILSEDITVRLDLSITDITKRVYSFVRDGEFLHVKDEEKTHHFSGISGNSSAEHVKLKEFIHGLFGSTFVLESKTGINLAPIEALLLPFYVSQDVGWVYIRKSFSNLDYYKNFKTDYLDYFLGIESFVNRERKRELEQKSLFYKSKIDTLAKIEQNSQKFIVAKIHNEEAPEKIHEYLHDFSEDNADLIKLEKQQILNCNEISYWKERRSILQKVRPKQIEEFKKKENCEYCKQPVIANISVTYKHEQEINDSDREIANCKATIKELQSDLNSIEKKIASLRESVKKRYQALDSRPEGEISPRVWVEEKVNLKISEKIAIEIGEATIALNDVNIELSKFSKDEDIEELRATVEKQFHAYFKKCLNSLNVTISLPEHRTKLYSVSAFPAQGSELHKIILAYHLSFYKLMAERQKTTMLPLMLDAIFKEDLTDTSKDQIVSAIANHFPKHKQIIISIAENNDSLTTANDYNNKHYNGNAKLIKIGDGISSRAFLAKIDGNQIDTVEETIGFTHEF
jgi:hypothetical protein